MKVLFTGPILDFSGFAHASRNFLQMLNEDKKIELVARALVYDKLDEGQEFVAPDWLNNLMDKPLSNIDMVLQMTTCNVEAVPVNGVVNGLYTFFETDRIQPSWANKANEFDFLIVPSKHNAHTLIRSGVVKPILVAPPPCNKEIYQKTYEPFEIKNAENRTIFYNVCQLTTKKGIDILLRAYYAAFAGMPNEALLVLKTYVNMHDRSNDLDIISRYVKDIRSRCRIPVQNHPPVLILPYTMTDEEINQLHVRGDVYVCCSRAEGWGIPVFDALAHGKTVISPDKGGLADFVGDNNALVVGGCHTFCFDINHQDPGLFTGIEQVFEPSPVEIATHMQQYHLLKKAAEAGNLNDNGKREWQSIIDKRNNALTLGQKFDFRTMHDKVVDQLLAVYKSWKETGVATYNNKSDSIGSKP